MRLKNNTTGLIIISDMPNGQGFGLPLPGGVEVLVFNEDAEKSEQLGSFLTSGGLLNLGPEEPSTGSPQAEAQPAAIGPYHFQITNQPSIGKALVATGPDTASWQSTAGTLTFIDSEVPAGLINGSNTNFTLANTPAPGSLHLYKGGLRQRPTVDYTIVGPNITFLTAPDVNTNLLADYRL